MRDFKKFDFKIISAAGVLLVALYMALSFFSPVEKQAEREAAVKSGPSSPPAAAQNAEQNFSGASPASGPAAGRHFQNSSAATGEAYLPPAPAARAPEVRTSAPPRFVSFATAASGVITGNAVNVRSESRVDAANSNVIVKVNKGERVQVIGSEKPPNDNRLWYKIKLKDGRTGFVRDDLIKIE